MKINPMSHKRSMDKQGILGLLARGDVGQVAMVDVAGRPYVIPVCFVYEDGRIFFHCAMSGKKLDCLRLNGDICFSVFRYSASTSRPKNPAIAGRTGVVHHQLGLRIDGVFRGW